MSRLRWSCCSWCAPRSSRASAASSRRPPPTSSARHSPDCSSTVTCSPTDSAIRRRCSDYARRMSEDAARLGRVVSNMLGFSQLERGNLSVDAQIGPLGEVLGEIAERARPALDRPVRRSISTSHRICAHASTATRSRGSSAICSTTRRSTPAMPMTGRFGSPRSIAATSSR